MKENTHLSCLKYLVALIAIVDISATQSSAETFITARNEVGARLCFYMCLGFCPQLVVAAETCTVGKRAVRILLECFNAILFIDTSNNA